MTNLGDRWFPQRLNLRLSIDRALVEHLEGDDEEAVMWYVKAQTLEELMTRLYAVIPNWSTPLDSYDSTRKKGDACVFLSKEPYKNDPENGTVPRDCDILLGFWCPNHDIGDIVHLVQNKHFEMPVPESRILLPLNNCRFYRTILSRNKKTAFYSTKPMYAIKCYVSRNIRREILETDLAEIIQPRKNSILISRMCRDYLLPK